MGKAVKHTLALSSLAVLQGEMQILACSSGRTVRETWDICQAALELESWPILRSLF